MVGEESPREKEHGMKRILVTLATLAAMGGLLAYVALQTPRLEKNC